MHPNTTCGFGLCHEPATRLVIAPTAIGRRAELLCATHGARRAELGEVLDTIGTVPTLEPVGWRIGYSADGLSRALRRRGLFWTAIRSDARRRSFGRFMSGEVA
jgi:hypothetical protein